MFKLTPDELDRAKAAIEHHGYGIYFPAPPEWKAVADNWEAVRDELIQRDLDEYHPFEPLKTYAPKSRINIRPIALLHPYDLLIYTALTLIVRDDIEAERVKRSQKRVFSHRSSPALVDALYEPSTAAHKLYRAEQKKRGSKTVTRAIAVTDIADFFPRVYHHRLNNIIRSVAKTPRATEVARVLVDKLLLNIAHGDSYGLPVGPLASSILAEAVLIDVDSALVDAGFNFVRWFDDYTFFCANEGEAQRALFALGQWLHQNHGLTLQPSKTKILSKASYLKGLSKDFNERIKARSETLYDWWIEVQDDYNKHVELPARVKKELDNLNLAQMLAAALRQRSRVDFEFAEFILGRIAATGLTNRTARDIAMVVVKNIPRLYPIVDTVATFLMTVQGLSDSDRLKVAAALLRPLTQTLRPPDFVAMWVLHVFASSPHWNHAPTLRKIYVETPSPLVKRYAALALALNGTRAEALITRDDLGGAKPLVRTAILAVWRKLGSDERGHLRRMSAVNNALEKAI